MGVFLEGCFLFTFITLVEYSITSYLQRKRTAFIKRANDNHINSLLDIPVQVPINWQKTSNVSDPSNEPKGNFYLDLNWIFQAFWFDVKNQSKSNRSYFRWKRKIWQPPRFQACRSLRSNGHKTVRSWCIRSTNAAITIHFVPIYLLGYLFCS